MVTLEIELLTGLYRAALPDGSGAEWPPHPERVFSALAQAWGDGGCDAVERDALEWLEKQAAPCIEADDDNQWAERTAPVVFVPPNDARGGEIVVLPDRRPRQARSFRAAVPADRFVRMCWTEAMPSPSARAALGTLALRVASLGHSSSLVRLAFTESQLVDLDRRWQPASNGRRLLRIPHEGRLGRLARWHAEEERPGLGTSARYCSPGEMAKTKFSKKSVFGAEDDWFVFEDGGGLRPDLLACAHVAYRVRAALMKLGPQPPSEILSGHVADGAASANPHVAVLPLASVGWDHATGDLLGFAVVLPRDAEGGERDSVLRALAAFMRLDQDEPFAELIFAAGTWRLEQTATPSRASLRPTRWCTSAMEWASVTPVLLDRFPDHGDLVEEGRLVAAACRNIGLPEPAEIELHKHSAVKGAPAAYPARGNRHRPDWSFPSGAKFASRPRRHVVLRFNEPVTGPVVLGAGRFYGLGLCLPIDSEDER
ncbi:MAG: type I-U CRISPR-associated protein Cas5/Cas6 [Hyphomicrobiales bacterium]|nr:type I-U CRISPR-associated protein Cas5/Cas6 [Hyphomicrobiales bacterium]